MSETINPSGYIAGYPQANPLDGTEAGVIIQQVGGSPQPRTFTMAQIAGYIGEISADFASPPEIGNETPNIVFSTFSIVEDYLVLANFAYGITATGNNLASAYNLTGQVNFVSNCVAGTGVRLPPLVTPGTSVYVANKDYANNQVLSVYPPLGGSIENLGINNPDGVAVGPGNWYFHVGGDIFYRMS